MIPKQTLLPLAVLAASGTTATPVEERPNLLFVLVDDLGWGGLALNGSAYGPERLNREFIERHVKDYTPAEAQAAAHRAIPALEKLCLDGARFTSAYSTANVSSPSRAGMLTSRYQERFGYYTNVEQKTGLPATETLMPEYLRRAGYTTACIGKYHLSPEDEPGSGGCVEGYSPLDRGFDYYFGFNSHGTTYYDSPMLHRGHEKVPAEGYLTDQLTGEAIGFIERSEGKPFMIYLAYNAVHGPLGAPAPQEYLDRFDYPSHQLNNYYAYLYAVDRGVERIMEKLRESGRADNTMVVFVSDNGAPGGAVNVLPKNGPLRGFKGQTWQGGVRVPMFIHVPGAGGGIVSDNLVSTMDIFPTFMDWAGIPLPEGLDGRSLMPLISGESDAQVREELVWMGQMAENWGMYNDKDQNVAPGGFMVRKGEWVLRYDIVARKFSLYDLGSDIGEQNDLSAAHPAVTDDLKDVFRRWYAEMSPPMGWKPELWKGVEFWDKESAYRPVNKKRK